MLAYVFWHWRRPEVDAASYTRSLAAFHAALRRHPPQGFVLSASFRGASAAWIPVKESYEDWYLTKGSQALDVLNDGAVSGACREPHHEAARGAAGGCAGLYRLRIGSGNVPAAGWTSWFSKPDGMTYDTFFETWEPLLRKARAGLWGRQMALGPTPEFCLMAPAPVSLPAGFKGSKRPLERLWPAAGGVAQPGTKKRKTPRSPGGPSPS